MEESRKQQDSERRTHVVLPFSVAVSVSSVLPWFRWGEDGRDEAKGVT